MKVITSIRRSLWAVFLLLAGIPVDAQTIDVDGALEEARRLAAARLTVRALETLEPLRNGEYAERALAEAGQIRFAAGDWSGAADEFLKLLDLRPDDPTVRASLLVSLEKSRRDDETRELLGRFGSGVEKDARMLAVRGLLAAREGNIDAAIADLQVATQIDTQDMFPAFELGVLLLTEGDPKAAVSHLEEADRRQPNTVGILYNLGLARMRAGDRKGGQEAMARSAEISKESNERVKRRLRAVALAYRAKDRFDTGDTGAALRDLEEAMALSPDDQGIRRFHAQMLAATGSHQ